MKQNDPRLKELAKLPPLYAEAFRLMADWLASAREKQSYAIARNDWHELLIRSGRGWGKTEMATGTIAHRLLFPPPDEPNYRIGLIVKRYQDAALILGRAGGLLNMLPAGGYTLNKTDKQLRLWNGTSLKYYSAREPDAIRGDEFNLVVMDEASSFRYPHILELVDFIRRRGRSQLLVTTTLKRNEITRELIRRIPGDTPQKKQIRGSTAENKHLPAHAITRLYEYYKDTAIGRQELHGEYVEDVPGAIFAQSDIDKNRIDHKAAHELLNAGGHVFSIGIDPQGAHRPVKTDADDTATLTGESMTGIVIASKGPDGKFYVWDDESLSAPPAIWAQTAAALADKYGSPATVTIVPETNFGGDMVISVIRAAAPKYGIQSVRATDSKTARAEPISLLYTQGKVRHVGRLPELEDEMTGFVPEERESPNRMDALVWALTSLSSPAAGDYLLMSDWQAILCPDDLPETLSPRRLYILGAPGSNQTGYLACPQGRQDCPPICIPCLEISGAPAQNRPEGISIWTAHALRPLTLTPSIWPGHPANPERADGCKCHFTINNGALKFW